jgi:peroxiredoxin family protein
LGVNATLDSGSLTSQVVRMKYTSNNAAATGDSVIVFYKSNCGNSANKASKLTNALRSVPAAPATLTITIVKDSCGNRVYRYAAPSLPAATTTTGNATGYQWSFKGSLGVNATLDSGSLTSMVVRMKYTSNIAAATGDSVIVYYTSDCGNSLKKASKLSNATTSAPATPTAITITLVWDFCGERVYRYSTTALASSFTNTGWGYKWSFVGDLGNNATLDSGSLTSQVVRMKYTSNNAAATGDSVKLNYVRGVCSSTSFKASKLSNLVKACREAAPNGRSSNNDLNSIHSSIYPNPNSGQFNLAYETNIQENCPAIIQIIDMKGVVVNQFNALNTNGIVRKEINDKKINNGFFIVRIIVNNKSFNTKMFIQT